MKKLFLMLMFISFFLVTGCENETKKPVSDADLSDIETEPNENINDESVLPDLEEDADLEVQDTDFITQDDEESDDDDLSNSEDDISSDAENDILPDDDVLSFYPSSCAEILTYDSNAVDGNYTLYAENDSSKPWNAYCADMNSTPVEYLLLVNTGEGYNYSSYVAGGGSSGTDVTTLYTAIRINPSTFIVTTGDQRFAASSSAVTQGGSTILSMPYATASECIQTSTPEASANVDLTGTPFIVDDTFCSGGNQTNGDAVFSASNQVVNITGGGYCGWTTPCPALYNPYNTNGADLKLSYISNN